MKKILGIGVIVTILLVPVLFISANASEKPIVKLLKTSSGTEAEKIMVAQQIKNRVQNIERIKARIASTTASTSEKVMNRLENQLQNQEQQMEKAKERLLNKELKVIEILGKISDKIADRIAILEEKDLDLSSATAKLAEANDKIEEVTTEADNLSSLLETEITEDNKDTLFEDIKDSQEKIKTLAKEAKALLVDTVKEITKVLPAKTATTTATSTETED